MKPGSCFAALRKIAEKRKGGANALDALLPAVKTPRQLAKIGDDRWLSDMTKRVFQAGFNWQLIEDKWPHFEDAFEGFGPKRWAHMSDDDMDRLVSDARIVRNGRKIAAVQKNAALLCDLAEEHGTAAKAIAQWPDADFAGLLELVKKRGSHLGGTAGQYVFRGMGKDGYVLSKDVVAALIREGVVTKPPSSKRDMAAVQMAFNQWQAESGLPLSHISRILAFTVGD